MRLIALTIAALLCGCATVKPDSTPRAADPADRPSEAAAPAAKAVEPAPVPTPPAQAAQPASIPTPATPVPAAPAAAATPRIETDKPAPQPVAKAVPPPPKAPPPPPVAATPPAPPTAPAVAPAEAPAGARAIQGQVELGAAGKQPLGAEEIANAVVYYVPNGGAPKPKPGQFSVITRDKRFIPSALVVPIGSTVSFPNQDPILHNVFSVTPGSSFDLGLISRDGSADVKLDSAGVVQVNCNVHHAMQVDIIVLDTPYYSRVGSDGRFALNGIPEGRGTLYFWHPRAGTRSRAVSVPEGGGISEKLLATRAAVPPHLNKEGKSYRPERN